MSFFNLPFSVRIAGAYPIDGDRYIAVDLSSRDALIGSGREFNGLQVYVESENILYVLVDKETPTWETLNAIQLSSDNGITVDNNVIELGGNLSKNTTIYGGTASSNYNLNLGTNMNRLKRFDVYSNAGTRLYGEVGGTAQQFVVEDINSTFFTRQINDTSTAINTFYNQSVLQHYMAVQGGSFPTQIQLNETNGLFQSENNTIYLWDGGINLASKNPLNEPIILFPVLVVYLYL